MAKYLRAELYKVFHRRVYTVGALGTILTGEVLLLLLMKFATGDARNTCDSVVSVLLMSLTVGLYLAVMVCDMVFSDQYKLNTLKNEVSYGLSRGRIYLGKLLSEIVTALIFCAVVVLFFLLLGVVLFPIETPFAVLLPRLGEGLATALPLWLGGLGFFHMLLFVSRGSTVATVIYVLVVAVLDTVLELLALLVPALIDIYPKIQHWLLATPFNAIANGAPDISHAWLVGMLWLLVSTALGLFTFQKREIG